MQVQNPQYKYYKRLEGTWKNSDGSCIVILDTYGNIKISYGGCELSSTYQVYEPYGTMMTGLGMLGAMYSPHPGEQLRFMVSETKLSDGNLVLFDIRSIWFGRESLNIEWFNTSKNIQETIMLLRDDGKTCEPYTCECGVTHTSRFCPNCGLPRKEQETFTCECGYSGPKGNFCPNCGKVIEKEYTCQCGYICKNVKFCPNCGTPTGFKVTADPVISPFFTNAPLVPAEPEEKIGWKCPGCGAENQEGKCNVCGKEIEPVMLFSVTTYMTTNPPVTTFMTVYEYSDTQLLLDNNGKRKLISADVIEPAMEIIRKNGLDDPDFKDPSAKGIMGGAVYVSFKDGDKYIYTSLQEQGYAVQSAQTSLMSLFFNA